MLVLFNTRPPLLNSISPNLLLLSLKKQEGYNLVGDEEMGSTDVQLFTFKEVSLHNKMLDCWLIISGKVYNVTPFLDEHPGGEQIILKATGIDATEHFDGINHSKIARDMLKDYYVGDLDCSTLPGKKKNRVEGKQTSNSKSSGIFQFMVPLFAIVLTYGLYHIY